jgi:hypothetical protein
MVGYSSTKKAYRVFVLSTSQVIESRDVVFHEDQHSSFEGAEIKKTMDASPIIDFEDNCDVMGSRIVEDSPRIFSPRKSMRDRSEPKRLSYDDKGKQVDLESTNCVFYVSHEEPKNVQEALNTKEWI